MTTATLLAGSSDIEGRRERGPRAAVRDAGLVAGRNLARLRRSPSTLAGALVFPLIFFFGFYAVLHQALAGRGVDFAQYATPAVVLQAMFFTAINSAFYLADDRLVGILERCRSLPMHRAAPLVGRVGADLVRSCASITVQLVTATLVGFRFHAGPAAAVAFVAVALLFTIAAAAGCSLVGLRASSPEAASATLFLPYLPLLMVSTAFIPVTGFPGWLQPFVRWQPVSLTADALRALSAGGATAVPVARAVVVLGCLTVAFGALGARAYGRLS